MPHQEKKNNCGKNKGVFRDNVYVCVQIGKPILPKNLYHWAALSSHGLTHVSIGGMCILIQATSYSKKKKNWRDCVMCSKHNAQGNERPKRHAFPKPQ